MGSRIQLSTEILYFALIRLLQPDLVCDIGSMDGTASLFFRKLLPNARVMAFEANPVNALQMRNNQKIRENRIEIIEKAVTNRNASLVFHVETTLSKTDTIRKGISSTRPRKTDSIGSQKVVVEGVRLDSFMESLRLAPRNIALWIDVEGASYEVLEGVRDISKCVSVVHVEVETKEVWLNQKLQPQVESLIQEMGFVFLAEGKGELQRDLVFVNSEILTQKMVKVKFALALTHLLTRLRGIGGRLYYRAAHI